MKDKTKIGRINDTFIQKILKEQNDGIREWLKYNNKNKGVEIFKRHKPKTPHKP